MTQHSEFGEGTYEIRYRDGQLILHLKGWAHPEVMAEIEPPPFTIFQMTNLVWSRPEAHSSIETKIELSLITEIKNVGS